MSSEQTLSFLYTTKSLKHDNISKFCLLETDNLMYVLMYVLNFIFLECSKAEIQTNNSHYKNICYRLQNHSSITEFIIYVYECLTNIYTKFHLPTMFRSQIMGPSL